MKEFIKLSNMQKVWKSVITEKFLSNDFFSAEKSLMLKWSYIINVLIGDKLVVKDVISRVNKAPTSTIFSSRDQDAQMRSYSIKRLAFCIISGTQNKLCYHIPAIREKLVALLKWRDDVLRPEVRYAYTPDTNLHKYLLTCAA